MSEANIANQANKNQTSNVFRRYESIVECKSHERLRQLSDPQFEQSGHNVGVHSRRKFPFESLVNHICKQC